MVVEDKGAKGFLMSLDEAADLLRCHVETLRRAIRVGELKAAKIGRGYLLSRKDLEDYFIKKGGSKLFED